MTGKKRGIIFGVLWLVTFVLYLPAARSGWVLDSAGWLHNIRSLSFADYINNAQSGIPSLYQFTQLTTWVFYKLFNANAYAWHTLMVSMHAANAFLFFMICQRLFALSGVKHSVGVALAGVLLYSVCPHISEVIVWEAAYHYLQGFMIILLVLYWVQQFHDTQRVKYVWYAAVAYFLSTYSLEIFYLAPWFVLMLCLYYRYALGGSQAVFSRSLRWFFLPQLVLFALHIVVLRMVYGWYFAHIGKNVMQPFTSYICKPPRYLFHILFFGRFMSLDVRRQVYLAIGSNAGLIIFYNIVVLICCFVVSRFSRFTLPGRAAVLLFAWMIIAQVIIVPLAFPDMQLVYFDRYSYFLNAFEYMLLALLASFISVRYLGTVLLAAYGLLNVFFTLKVNLLWKHSGYIVNRLLKNMPDPGNKTVIFLDLPQNMQGIPMILAMRDGEFKKMYQLFVNPSVSNKMYDVVSYNMKDPGDGAHVVVHNDSLLRVTLNEWGTWWQYDGNGAVSYENEDYKLEMRDMGHWYDIIFKHPLDQYLILLQQGDQWKVVNTTKKKRGETQY